MEQQNHEVGTALIRLLAFTLGRWRYALPLGSVSRVVRIVEVAELPKAPDFVLGVINVRGRIIPVLSMRRRFGMQEEDINLNDQLIIADTGRQTVALLVSSVAGIVERFEEEITEAKKIVPGVKYVEGIAKLEDGVLFIHNLDRFLTSREEEQLRALLDEAQIRQ